MKLVSLNTWGATQGQIFFDYIKEQAETADIFCLQEVFSAEEPAPKLSSGARCFLFQELVALLPGFKGYFAHRSRGYDFSGEVGFPLEHGMAVFIKHSLKITDYSVINLSHKTEPPNEDPVEGETIVQIVRVGVANQNLSIINYHGPAQPGNKLDTPLRVALSQSIKTIWEKEISNHKILCGDFNLMPETESIKLLEGCGKNLIKAFNIQNTRNEISWAKYQNRQSFADFTFVSPLVKVKDFVVPYNLVSDHLPMVLDFAI
jgi:endonuclease/exonuclease/phosphatase family metal-dependent hydrolase